MPTQATTDKAREWVTRLHELYGLNGVAHEVAAVWNEQQVMSERAKRYSLAMHESVKALEYLFDETGDERILDVARWLGAAGKAAEYADNWQQLALSI